MGRGSAGTRLRGMGRGNDAKTALRVIVKMIENHGQGQYNGKFGGMDRGSARTSLWGIGRGSAGARFRGMGRGNDAKTALRVIKETK